MDIKDLMVFMQVYENRSMNKAAQILFLSTQSISKIIKKLEAEFGVVLFERTTSGVMPTSTASLLMPKIKYLIDDFNHLKNIVDGSHHLRIAATSGVLSYLTPQFLQDFQQFQPNVELEIIELQDLMTDEALWNESMELGFRLGPINYLKYDTTLFSQHRFCVVIPKEHPLAALNYISYQHLKEEPLIIVKGFHFYPAFFAAGVVPKVLYETADLAFINQFSAKYKIVAISLDFYAFQHETSGIVIRPFADMHCICDVYLVTKKNKPLSKNTRIFKTFALEWIQVHKRDLFYWDVPYPADFE